MSWVRSSLIPVVLTVAIVPLASHGVRAEEKDPVRERLLKLNDITGTDPMEGALRSLIADPAGTKKLLARAAEMAREKDQPFTFNAAYILARAAKELKETETGKALYEICAAEATRLKSAYKLLQVYDDLFELYYETKDYEQAVKAAQKFLEQRGGRRLDRLDLYMSERMVQAMAKQGKYDEALKLADSLVALDKGGWYFLQLRASVLREANRLDEAVKAYDDVLTRLAKSDELEDQQKERMSERVRYILSSVYVDMNQIDKAAEQLKSLLKSKPDDPTYNNDLGFIWADHDMNLDESEKLIRKAIEEDRKQRKADPDLTPEEDKDNSAYLDSLGWVLYKKKQYQEAKKYLLEAVAQPDGQHIEILDHLADVHMALGETKEAIAVWQKALKLENLSRREKVRRENVEKKLKAAEQKK